MRIAAEETELVPVGSSARLWLVRSTVQSQIAGYLMRSLSAALEKPNKMKDEHR